MPVAGGPFIQKTGILLEVDAANAASYPGTGTTWANLFRPGTYNGTLTGSITYNSTDAYGALQFPANNSYVDFGNVGDLSVSWSFQVAVKPAPSASGNYTILSYTSGSGSGSLTFKLDYSSSNQVATLSSYSVTGSTQIVHRVTGSVSTGSWSIINASYGSSIIGMYVNGRPTDYLLTTGSTVGYSANNKLVAGGTNLVTSSYYSGSLASLLVYNADVANTRIIQNYNAFATRFGLPPSNFFPYATDPDAFRFIEIANITDPTQASAINGLVVGLKSNNLWDKMQVIYPFVGGNAFSHKWNLKDPRDLNSEFRLQYVGVINHLATGVQSGGGYIQSPFKNTDFLQPTASSHYSAYAYSAPLSVKHNIILGAGIFDNIWYSPDYFGTTSTYLFSVVTAQTSGTGYGIVSRLDTTTTSFYRYFNTGTSAVSSTGTPGAPSTTTLRILGTYDFTAYDGIINFVTLGAGLTSTDAAALNTLVRNFNIALSRNAV